MKTYNTITIPCGIAYDHQCSMCRGVKWVKCNHCDGTGKLSNGLDCYRCNGKGYVDCPACDGTGVCAD